MFHSDRTEALVVGAGPVGLLGTSDWVRRHVARIAPCVPASSDDLGLLLEQIGLSTHLGSGTVRQN